MPTAVLRCASAYKTRWLAGGHWPSCAAGITFRRRPFCRLRRTSMTSSPVAALIMAGGRSERMRAGGTGQHKGLRTVLGVPLIERNLRALLWFGFARLFVAINEHEKELGDWIGGRGRALAESESATLETLV